jgi:hypothetical protein
MGKRSAASGPVELAKIATAQQRKKRQSSADSSAAKEQRVAALAKAMTPRLYRKCRSEARKAAEEGSRSALVTVLEYEQSCESESYQAASRATQAVVELLVKKRFAAKQKSDEMKPFGSDPMFPYTVYSLYIEISF